MEKVCTSQKIVFLHVKLTKAYFLRQVKMSLEAAIAARATALHPNKVFNQRASARVLKVVLLAVFPHERQNRITVRYIPSLFATGQR